MKVPDFHPSKEPTLCWTDFGVQPMERTFVNKTVTRHRDGQTEPGARGLCWPGQSRAVGLPRLYSARGSPGQDGHRREGPHAG